MSHKSPITCHVLDSTLGKPAKFVAVELEQLTQDGEFISLAKGATDADGRASQLLPAGVAPLAVGTYKMVFQTEAYFSENNIQCFYPKVERLTASTSVLDEMCTSI
ncbi:Transthyretin and related proteins [Phaffia rhodozyma]|uniref:Transthyretin and related proteins n=1 Tax=Phaffia rhodozyma TaxID=264483 RepID=A0A0F7SLM2_PHARH|nr:Transthyretin and related proteins [Phaffia rhodozyma]